MLETDDEGAKAWTRPDSIEARLSRVRNREIVFIVKFEWKIRQVFQEVNDSTVDSTGYTVRMLFGVDGLQLMPRCCGIGQESSKLADQFC
mmetsp:Transcript_8277/g.17147  ORF Transcript_8277/g.17147 Transcript_8277/m.17147 type:complete len:90 (+) Transcript_8277:981-1250(+)